MGRDIENSAVRQRILRMDQVAGMDNRKQEFPGPPPGPTIPEHRGNLRSQGRKDALGHKVELSRIGQHGHGLASNIRSFRGSRKREAPDGPEGTPETHNSRCTCIPGTAEVEVDCDPQGAQGLQTGGLRQGRLELRDTSILGGPPTGLVEVELLTSKGVKERRSTDGLDQAGDRIQGGHSHIAIKRDHAVIRTFAASTDMEHPWAIPLWLARGSGCTAPRQDKKRRKPS